MVQESYQILLKVLDVQFIQFQGIMIVMNYQRIILKRKGLQMFIRNHYKQERIYGQWVQVEVYQIVQKCIQRIQQVRVDLVRISIHE
ncbi:unnamed protein product [Paramecium sonneborni]|uniref:Uncharacterized protein n=1 Tax=Paramecium sonneborni TaxID=65129 RepID=A0A8S1RTK0_9CILI|nr:unnamed protein product [Paramecium sonneborni]